MFAGENSAQLDCPSTEPEKPGIEGHGQQKGHLQGHLQGLRMGQHDMFSSFNMTRILPPYFWIFWSSASSVSSPNQSLNSDHSMPIGLCPNIPLQASKSSPVVFDVSGSLPSVSILSMPNWKLQTNSDRVVVLSFGNPWGAPSTQPTSNLGFRYRTFLFLWWLGLRTGLTQVTLW